MALNGWFDGYLKGLQRKMFRFIWFVASYRWFDWGFIRIVKQEDIAVYLRRGLLHTVLG